MSLKMFTGTPKCLPVCMNFTQGGEGKMSQYVEYGSLRFTNDFVFCHVLIENPELCKKIAELAIGRKIKEIKTPQTQKSIK